MSIKGDLDELINEKVITSEVAGRIGSYYETRRKYPANRLLLIFGVIGAILVGLGVILIIAHNWDELPVSIKSILAFLPLVVGQIFCGYTLLKKRDNEVWQEGTAAFLFFAISAAISLISQIYNISGTFSSFMLAWMLLSLPIIYIMQSSIVSLLYLIGITLFSMNISYFESSGEESYIYWGMLLAVIPFYLILLRKRNNQNSTFFHNYFIPLSMTICLGTLAQKNEEWMFIAYMSLFAIFSFLGNQMALNYQTILKNGFKVLGSLGMTVLLTTLSFDWFWEDLLKDTSNFYEQFKSNEFMLSAILTITAGVFLVRSKMTIKELINSPEYIVFLLFVLVYIFGLFSAGSTFIMNVIMLLTGIMIIRKGVKKDHLGILNYGLLIITTLIICRFFDKDLSFIIRGILFIAVGMSFFFANYRILKNRKNG